MSTARKIEFNAADGIRLRGLLFSAGTAKPCIIMSNGFSGLKEQFLPDFAQRFLEAGYTSIIYDNRNWGESEGLPRNETDPNAQIRDYFAAFEYASALPDVDATRIVYWGSSMSAGNAISAAAVDKRIRGVIAQVPFMSGSLVTNVLGPKAELVFADRAAVIQGADSAIIRVVPESREEVLNGTSTAILNEVPAVDFLDELTKRGIGFERDVTMQSLLYLQQYEPRAMIRRVCPTPLLMVVAEKDVSCSTSMQLSVYEEALEPKRVHVLRGATHFSPYFGRDFEENIRVQLDFLKDVMSS